MPDIQPPPTYEMPVQIDEQTKKARFSANWLKWFIDLTGILNSAGGTTLEHNLLDNIQGGSASEYYHLTQTQHGALVDAKSANTFYAGPASGSPAVPAFRALVAADLPAGTGTVTSVSVVTANGVSGSVANATTTPAITLTLGAITPSSVSTGSVTSSALTSGRVTFAGTAGLLTDSVNFRWQNTNRWVIVLGNNATPATGSGEGFFYANSTDGAVLHGNGTNDVTLKNRSGTSVAKIIGNTTQFSTVDKIYPGTDAAAFQTAAGLYAGTGAPNNANGNDGDFYFRSDGGLLTTIYQRRAGAWVGVV